jgi:uncharacterized protein
MGINRPYGGAGELPTSLPIFPLPCALLLPRSELPLNIFEPRYIAMVDHALRSNRLIGMVQPKEESGALFPVGCAGRITGFIETGDGRYQMTLTGVARFRCVAEEATDRPFRSVTADWTAYESDLWHREEDDAGVDRDALFDALKGYAGRHSLSVDWDSVRKAPSEALVNALSMMSPFGVGEKQALLEARTVSDRADMLIAITRFELASPDDGPARIQ